jgi:hypothetical protein
LLERTCFGIFSGKDKDGDEICKCLFECKEIQYSGGYYYLPYIDQNQLGCLLGRQGLRKLEVYRRSNFAKRQYSLIGE